MKRDSESYTYRIAKKIIPNLSLQYSKINIWEALRHFVLYYYRERLHIKAKYSYKYGPLMAKRIRARYFRKVGCNIGDNVFIGREVFIDPRYPEKITIEEGVFLCARSMLIAHKRDIKQYKKGKWIGSCEHEVLPIVIKRGAHIGVGTIILPGVTVGEGSIIGAGSVVVKDIPAYVVAVGVPAKIIKEID